MQRSSHRMFIAGVCACRGDLQVRAEGRRESGAIRACLLPGDKAHAQCHILAAAADTSC